MAEAAASALQVLTEVPPLPANFTGRKGLSDAIFEVVTRGLKTSGLVGIHGEGGMGKTVATCAFLEEVASNLGPFFPDGVAFLTVGQTPHIIGLQASLLRAFGFSKPLVDTADGYARILEVLAGRKCLLVLDDVWESQHLDMFASLQSRPKAWVGVIVLFTTRFRDLVPSHAQAELLKLGELSDLEASALLEMPASDEKLAQLMRLCARSPLALSILGACKRTAPSGDMEWQQVLDRLEALAKHEKNAVKRCIAFSVDKLQEKTRSAYLKLAVFPDDVLLPVAALRHIFGDEVVAELPALAMLHLIRLEGPALADSDDARVRLHDLSLEFIKEQAQHQQAGEREMHRQLLTSYAKILTGEGMWWTGPNDGYFFQHLLNHLRQADRSAEACRLVLRWEWLWAKTRSTRDIVAVIHDVRSLAPTEAAMQHTSGHAQSRGAPQGAASNAAKAKHVTGSTPSSAASNSAGAKAKAKAKPAAAGSHKPAAGTGQGDRNGAASSQLVHLSVWQTLLEVLTLSAHVVAEDAQQLPFQVHGRLLGLAGPASEEKVISDLQLGAWIAMQSGSYASCDGLWKVSAKAVSAGSLQGVGGPLRRTLQLHKDWVRSLVLSEDGSTLVTGSSDLTVKVWDLHNDFRLRWNLAEHQKAVIAVAVAGSVVVSGDEDAAIVWNLQTGAMVHNLDGLQGELMALCFIAGSDLFACACGPEVRIIKHGSHDKGKVAPASLLKVASCSHDDKVAALASSRGQSASECLLACGGWDKQVVLWRLLLKSKVEVQKVACLNGGEQDVWAVALTPDGTALACGSHDSTMHLWTLGARQAPKLKLTATSHSDWIHSICMSADSSLIATGSDDNTIALYSTTAKQVVGRAKIFSGAFAVALSPDASMLYTASGDIRIWSTAELVAALKKESAEVRHSSTVTGLDVSAAGDVAASVAPKLDEDGKCVALEVMTWNCGDARALLNLHVPGSADDDDRPCCLSLRPSGDLVAIGSDTGKLWVLDVAGATPGTCTPMWEEAAAHTDRILCTQWLNEETFATGSEDGYVKCWSVKTRTCLSSAKLHKNSVKCMDIGRGGKRILTGSDYEPARWSELTGECILELKEDVAGGESSVKTACSVAVSGDEKFAVTCSWDKVLRVWDLSAGVLILAVQEVSEWVVKGFGASLSGSDWGLCLSYSWDRSIQLWDFTDLFSASTQAAAPDEKEHKSTPLLVDASGEGCRWKRAVLQCDASLVRMAAQRRWSALHEGGRTAAEGSTDASSKGETLRSLVFSDEDGGVHFFQIIGCTAERSIKTRC